MCPLPTLHTQVRGIVREQKKERYDWIERGVRGELQYWEWSRNGMEWNRNAMECGVVGGVGVGRGLISNVWQQHSVQVLCSYPPTPPQAGILVLLLRCVGGGGGR